MPDVAAVTGVGRVVHHERLADGRFHLLLQGVARAVLHVELPMEGLLYRRARAARHRHDDGDQRDADDEVRALRDCYMRMLQCSPDARHMLGELPLCACEPCVLADIACDTLLHDVTERQRALEEPSVVRRLRCANDALAALLLHGLTEPRGGLN